MNKIKELALSVGFDACGIAQAEELAQDALFLQSWLTDGKHGEMLYLSRNFEKRVDPRKLVPGCKSVVVVLLNYFPHEMQNMDAPQVAKYAYSEIDYHRVMKEKLSALEEKVISIYGNESINTEVQHTFVDSAPVLERRWAERAGLGWIGKNTQLICPELGSYVFIGVLMLNIELEHDLPITARCGTCTRCIDACPTNALQNGSLDARRCISYLTIENKGGISPEFQSLLSGYAVGCDICADVCPWNKKWAKPYSVAELRPITEMLRWDNQRWQTLNENEFKEIFRYSAIQRTGFEKLKRTIEKTE